MKKLLYVFSLWVVMSDNSVWKYPQATYYLNSGVPSVWTKRTYELIDAQKHKLVVELPRYKVVGIFYEKPKQAKRGYHVYWNTGEGFTVPAYQDSEEIIWHGVKVRVENHSTFVPSDEVIMRGLLDAEEIK